MCVSTYALCTWKHSSCYIMCVCVLLQDIVTASPHFSVEGFIPRLRDYLRVTNPYKRQFLISWVSELGK